MLVVLFAFTLAGFAASAPAPDAGFGYSEDDLLPAVFDTANRKYTGVPEHFDGSSRFFQPKDNQFQSFGSQFNDQGSNSFAPSPNFGSQPSAGLQSTTRFNSPQPRFQNNFAQSSPNFQSSSKNSPSSQDFQSSQNFQTSQNFRPSTATQRPFISILERNQHHDPNGQYTLSVRDSAGTSTYEEGKLRPSTLKEGGTVLAKSGGYSYTSPEGYKIKLSYTADENGFRPSGSP